MSSSILQVKNLTKEFGDFRAVDRVSFDIKKGQVVGLLGPNGAGKTTTIHMLLGITTPTEGTITYFGRDFETHRQYCFSQINFASAYNTLQVRISVWENLVVFSHLYNIKGAKEKIRELVRYFEVESLLHKRLWDLSAGQKTRVNLVKALLNDPKLILMDEPTASLDPDIADKTLSLIEKLKAQKNLSILFTSHNMDEVARICDTVIFLDRGKIVAHDTPLGLTKRIKKAGIKITFEGDKDKVNSHLKGRNFTFSFPASYIVHITNIDEKELPNIIFKVSKTGVWITNIEIEKPTLEDVFLQIARGRGI